LPLPLLRHDAIDFIFAFATFISSLFSRLLIWLVSCYAGFLILQGHWLYSYCWRCWLPGHYC
jgi:hypothetical protein